MECPRGRVEEAALAKIKPSRDDEERARRVVEKALRLLDNALRRAGMEGYELRVEGSYAKGTWLRDSLEVDVFALFEPPTCLRVVGSFADRVSKILGSMGVPFELRYAQHPYVRIYVDGVPVEAVPGCRVRSPREIMTPVDRTPFHTEVVKKLLSDEMRDEVRLLKSFTKGIGVYGAEVAVRGFSGYLLELLVARHRCFRGVLEAAATSWKPPVKEALPGQEGALGLLEKRYPGSIFYFPDPVDPARNVASPVSARSLGYMILASRLYLDSPSERFFHYSRPQPKTPPSPSEWGNRITSFILVEVFMREREAPDNAWGMAWRLAKLVERILNSRGFEVAYAEPYASDDGLRIAVAVEVYPHLLPPITLRRGPPAWTQPARVKRFLEKHAGAERGPWVDETGSLAALALTNARSPLEVLERELDRSLPSSIKTRMTRLRVLRGVYAAEEAGRLSPQWAWSLARGAPDWLKPSL